MKPIEVECIHCGRPDGHPCALKDGKDTTLIHIQRKLLWILRQENSWAQLLSPHEDGYTEEQLRLQIKLQDMGAKKVTEAPHTPERSLIEEIESTPQGRSALRFASENCDLRELLDLAHRIISEGQNASLSDVQAFAKGYVMLKEK